MHKPFPYVPVLVLVVVGLFGYAVLQKSGTEPSPATPDDTPAVTWDVVTAPGLEVPAEQTPADTGGVPEQLTPEQEAQLAAERRIADTIAPQYWPEASVNLTGGKLGTQRVPFTEELGDVHQVLFHLPSYTLFMSVTEPDGLHAVWQMKENRKPERVFAASYSVGDLVLFQTSDGTIYVQRDNPCELYRSGDGFRSWHLVSRTACMFWSMADNGNGEVYGTLHNWNEAVLWHSPDNGFSWEPWKDFQKILPEYAVPYADGDDRFKLRHLHDVFYDQASGQIVVGTGDVARFALASSDGGNTWKQVWDEGFTAHVPLGGGDRFLLGPDQLHNHGIGLYDAKTGKTREVWNPRPHGYAGYVYSMANVDGIYYAAVHTEANEVATVVPKFGIIVSPDGEKWYRFLEWGPLTNHARTDIWLTPAPGLVYASVNGALYAFRPLDKDWFADKQPFGAQ